jgi:rhamnogalacturonan acetylesterase
MQAIQSNRGLSGAFRRAFCSLTIAAALGTTLGLTTVNRAQGHQPLPNEHGDINTLRGQQAAPGERGAGATPQVQAHSPRDDMGQWSPTDFARANPNLPTLVIAGDSTAATGDPNHRGWGAPLIDYFDTNKVNIINRAVAGRSFRTFYGEGKWRQVVDALKQGDFVVIEFGHNDGGGIEGPMARGDLPGTGDETQTVTRADGTTETVHTYGWYTHKFIRDVKEKGATPIVSSTTVRNIWSNPNAAFRDATITSRQDNYSPADDRVERGMGHMMEWANLVAKEENVAFVDQSNITADQYEKMGREETSKFFPVDHTHTSTDGAVLNAETFIAGLKALPNQRLVGFLNDKGKAIETYRPASK